MTALRKRGIIKTEREKKQAGDKPRAKRPRAGETTQQETTAANTEPGQKRRPKQKPRQPAQTTAHTTPKRNKGATRTNGYIPGGGREADRLLPRDRLRVNRGGLGGAFFPFADTKDQKRPPQINKRAAPLILRATG